MDGGTSAVTVAVITAVVAPTWLTWWQTRRAHRTLRGVDEAVNRTHTKPDGSPRLYDAVLEMAIAQSQMIAQLDNIERAFDEHLREHR